MKTDGRAGLPAFLGDLPIQSKRTLQMANTKSFFTKATIITLLIMTAACGHDPERSLKKITLDRYGSSLETAEGTRMQACNEFTPTLRQVANFFNRAYPVKREVMTTTRNTPCYSSGSLEFSDKSGGTWILLSSGVASFEFTRGDKVILYYKDNQWFDPTACTYTLDRDEKCRPLQ